MLKKTITYTDYNGATRTEDFYFNLSKAELLEMEITAGNEGFADALQRIIAANDGKGIVDTFKRMIQQAYGIKTEKGGFRKTPELLQEFMETEAYSVLFVELATDADAAANWIKGVVPSDLAAAVHEAEAKQIQNVELPAEENPKADLMYEKTSTDSEDLSYEQWKASREAQGL